jgi:hypothetical protein
MVAWDHVLDGGMPAIEEAFSSGRLQIPSACPVEGARLLEGPIFGPLLLDEKPYRFRFTGVGNLLVRGMSIAGEPAGLLQHLSAAVGKYKLPRALAQLVDLLAVETGLGEFFIERRRLGLIEHVYRLDNGQQALSLEIHQDVPDLRSRDPVRHIVVKRNALLQGQALRLHVRLGNYDDTIGDRLVDLPADAAGVTVEANTHVTDVSIVAFDEAGERVDAVGGAFIQGRNFGLAVLGTVDELPPPFAGSPPAPDLERRPRLHTTSFESPTAGDRSGTLDVLRKSALAINRFLGERTFRGESKWFEARAPAAKSRLSVGSRRN